MANDEVEQQVSSMEAEQRALFVDTSLDTHLALLVSDLDTVSHVKQKILLDHPKCFPDFGEIKVNSLKVKQKGNYYHLSDSMLVKTAFHGKAKNWFLFADASGQFGYSEAVTNRKAIVLAGPSKMLSLLVGPWKHSDSEMDYNKDECFGTYSSHNGTMLLDEMPKKFDPSNVHRECKSVEESLKPGGSRDKKLKKKRKRSEVHCDVVDENEDKNHLDKEYKREMENVNPKKESLVWPSGINSKTPHIEYPDQSYGDDFGDTFSSHDKRISETDLHKNMLLSGEVKESPEKDTNLKSSRSNFCDEAFSSDLVAKKRCKVENSNVQKAPLLETESLISGPVGNACEPEPIVNNFDRGDLQKSGLIELNGLPLKVFNTSKDSRKRKKEKKHPGNEFSEERCSKENMEDSGDRAQKASAIATDAVAKKENVPGTTCMPSSELLLKDGSNNLVEDVQEEAQLSCQPEGTSPGLAKLENKESGIGDVGVAPGSRAKKTKNAKRRNVDVINTSHPKSSSEVDLLKNSVAPPENENAIHDSGTDCTKTTEVEVGTELHLKHHKNHQLEPSTLVERERGVEEDVPPIKSLDMNGVVDLGSTAKKRKTKKDKKCDKEKDVSIMMINQDVVTHIAGDDDKYGSSNEVDRAENVLKTDKTKDVNEILDTGSRSKKKKKKKKKKKRVDSVIEKPDVSNLENNKDVSTCINSNGPIEDHNKNDLADEDDKGENIPLSDKGRDLKLETASISSTNDDRKVGNMREIGELLPPAQVNKPEENVDLRSDEPKKRAQKKQDVSAKREQFEEIPSMEVLTCLTEVRELEKPQIGKKAVKKPDVPSSVDTSSNGHELITSKKCIESVRTSLEGILLQNDGQEAEQTRKIDAESLQLSQVNNPEEKGEIKRDKPKKRTQKKQTVPTKELPDLPVKEQLDEKSREMASPETADDNPLINSNINGPKQQKGGSLLGGRHEEFNEIPSSEVSSSLAEVRKLDKARQSKQKAKNLDFPSSVDPLITSKKSRGNEKTSLDGPQLQTSVTELNHDRSMLQRSAKPSKVSKEDVEAQLPEADSINSVAKLGTVFNENNTSRKRGSARASMDDGSKYSGASIVSLGSSAGRTHQRKNAKNLQKKPDENHLGFKRFSRKSMGEVVNASPREKGFSLTSGGIFEDGSGTSSDDEDKRDGSNSDTKTPSDNLSSSDSEGESERDVVTSQHDSPNGGGTGRHKKQLNSSALKDLKLESVLRSSTRFRKAKLAASQLEENEGQPLDFVPDSQANP